MNYGWPDAVGILGSVIFIGAFAYANASKTLNKLLFNGLNLFGAICLMVSLWQKFNLAAFVLEAAWAVIAVIGLIAALRSRSKASL
jgi:energy-converting hydrogenase Eha subunit C